jgi:hypothetical protein
MCAEDYVPLNGTCVPNTNECETVDDPCGPNTNCSDPTSASNNWVCTCRPGYQGADPENDGCANINECAGNPCGAGRGTCTENAPGQGYSCTCGGAYMEVDDSDSTSDPTCSCDLNGTFAIRIATTLSWDALGVDAASGVVTYSWALRTQTYDEDGTLQVETVPCGGTTPDICSGSAAYAQYLPNNIWGTASMPTEAVEMSLLRAYPGGDDFRTPKTAALLGLSLTDPLGAWPGGRCNIGGWDRPGCSAGTAITNGASLVNHDGDTRVGVTSYAVPPGGVTASDPPAPVAYGSTSPVCPRPNSGSAYDWWPDPFVETITSFQTATRVISYLDGDFVNCNRITGLVQGCTGAGACPADANGTMHTSGRIVGCTYINNGNRNTACANATVNFFDGLNNPQRVDAASFIIQRVTDTTPTCAEVRAMTF